MADVINEYIFSRKFQIVKESECFIIGNDLFLKTCEIHFKDESFFLSSQNYKVFKSLSASKIRDYVLSKSYERVIIQSEQKRVIHSNEWTTIKWMKRTKNRWVSKLLLGWIAIKYANKQKVSFAISFADDKRGKVNAFFSLSLKTTVE